MSAPRELADVAAELETLRLADVEAWRQIHATRRHISKLADHCDSLLTAITARRITADALLDEWLEMQAAHAVAEALLDEGDGPARVRAA